MRKIRNFRSLAYCFAAALSTTVSGGALAPISLPADEALLSKDKALNELPNNIKNVMPLKAGIEFQIARDFFEIRSVCQATKKFDTKEPSALSAWLDKNISQDEWQKSPLFFKRAAYRSTAIQEFSYTKVALLGKIQKTIPNHPEFIHWLEGAKALAYKRIQEDELLSREIKDWDNVMADKARLTTFMERASTIALNIFLVKKSFPAVVVGKDVPPLSDGRRLYARYEIRNNVLRYNMGETGIHTAETAIDNVVHETLHTAQWRFAQGYRFNGVQSFIYDEGEKYFFSLFEGLGEGMGGLSDKDFYRNTFTERASFFVSNSTNEPERSPQWFNANASAKQQYQNPYLGEIPKACFK